MTFLNHLISEFFIILLWSFWYIYIYIYIYEKEKKRQYGKSLKISQMIKNKSLLSIEKNITEWGKMRYYNYKKVFFLLRLPLKRSLTTKRDMWNVWFSGFASSLLNYKKFFKLGARKFHFPKYKTFFQSEFFFIFPAWKFSPEI